ncbi:MAG: glycosyltransferase [Planctomycetota bacterium]
MKILHAISGIETINGGPSVALGGLARAQVRAGFDVGIVATYHQRADHPHGQAIAKGLQDDGIDVTRVGPATTKFSRHPDIVPTLQRLVPEYDVVHIHGLFEEIQHQAGRISRKHKTAHLYRTCGMVDPWSLKQGWLRKKLYFMLRLNRDLRGATAMHAVTPMEKKHIEDLNFGSPVLMELNGIDLEEFRDLPEPGGLRRRLPEAEGRPIVLFLSRLHPKKALDVLIPAVRRVIDKSPDAPPYLALVGPIARGYEETVDALLTASNMDGHATKVGMLHGRDRLEAFVDADVYALPSYQENFGIAVVEAMAAGVPTIASDNVAVSHLFHESGAGVMCKAEAGDVATKLTELLQDAQRRKQLGEAGRAWAMDTFDWNAIAERWKDHYAKLVADMASA